MCIRDRVSRLEVPILNPGLIALKVCENLVELGIAHSKAAYRGPEVISDDAFRMGELS